MHATKGTDQDICHHQRLSPALASPGCSAQACPGLSLAVAELHPPVGLRACSRQWLIPSSLSAGPEPSTACTVAVAPWLGQRGTKGPGADSNARHTQGIALHCLCWAGLAVLRAKLCWPWWLQGKSRGQRASKGMIESKAGGGKCRAAVGWGWDLIPADTSVFWHDVGPYFRWEQSRCSWD